MERAGNRLLRVSGPERLGYERALAAQMELLERCHAGDGRENFLMPVEHPPVITVGRSGGRADVLADAAALKRRAVEVVETNRGGKVTFHGPGQLVAYPVLDLRARERDLHRYLRDLEKWLIGLLRGYGIEAGVNPPHTGVWVDEAKIASIGIAVRHWISYHGIALNVSNDLSFFDLIVPCGMPRVRMTSMAELLGREPELDEVAVRGAREFAATFGFERVSQEVAAK